MPYFGKITIIVAYAFILTINLSCFDKEKMIMTKLSPYSDIYNLGQKYKYYVVQNFEFGNKQQFEELKKFAEKNLDSDYSTYAGYAIEFYKESSRTPINFKQTEFDLILWHGNDLIYLFEWKNGKFLNYYEYKNGKIISK